MKKLTFLILAIVLVMAQILTAQEEVSDHPVIKPIDGSTQYKNSCKHEDHGSFKFTIKEGSKTKYEVKEGKYWQLVYKFLDANGKKVKDFSAFEIIGNYEKAVQEKGGKILYKTSRKMTFMIPGNGAEAWCNVQAGNAEYKLIIIETAALEAALTFGADEIKAALDKDGKIAIYGINFDTSKASLKPGAEKIIIEFVKLMQKYPELKIEIQGHTDSSGTAAGNKTLSARRAETVKQFMLTFGVPAARLQTRGFGQEKPVASNDTEEGKAKNRRVELIKL